MRAFVISLDFARTRHVLLALLSFGVVPGAAQAPQPTQQQSAPPVAPDNAPAGRPGLLEDIGKLLRSPIDMLPSPKKPEPDPQPDAASVTPKEAAREPESETPPAVSSRLLPGIVSGREICPRAGNGASDCKAGSDRLCQSRGFKEGKSLSTDSAYGCSMKPVSAALQGRREGKLCGTENYVTRAFCQ